jgi:choline dehydrogenase-like flavoprotein
MFIDARTVQNDAVIEADVCIIGAGVAGITLAMEFDRLGIRCCVLESGGLKADHATRDLNRGASGELPYSFADGCRSRFLGGSSNCWGGWSRPLEEHDFAQREWLPHSGWPISRADLELYYRRTHEILQLGRYDYDTGFWEAAVARNDVKRLPLVTGRMTDSLSVFSPPSRFGKVYRDALKRSRHITTYLYANVVELQTNAQAGGIQSVKIATLTGRRFTASARFFILATGGIENARLLLASNRTQAAGLGNGHDVVGRYFMDHPRISWGSVHFAPFWKSNRLFDLRYHYQTIGAHDTRIAAQFVLTPEVQRQEQLANARVWFSSEFAWDKTLAAEALLRIKHRWQGKEEAGTTFLRDLAVLARSPGAAAGFAMTQWMRPRPLISQVRLQAIVEPDPDPEARVTLSQDRDSVGLQRVHVAWRLGSIVRRTFDRNFAILADELQRTGVAVVEPDPMLENRTDWPDSLDRRGTFHHMGTTRMHDSPRYGVVDRDCKVHGISNLYVAGSSVFPTAGANFPTMTIVALALRLAAHLLTEMKFESAVRLSNATRATANRSDSLLQD